MIAVKKVASVADTIGGTVESVEEHDGRIVQICVHCKGGLQILAVFFWHSECWTARK